MISALLVLTACVDHDRPASVVTQRDTIKNVVDSIFPVEEEVRRFKAARPGAAAKVLSDGATSRDELVQRFIRALEEKDSTQLRKLQMSAAEFIDLYYPTSIYSRPPHKQSPELFWFLLQENSGRGIRRALDRFGGQPLGFQGYTCNAAPLVQGANRFWSECRVRWQRAGKAASPFGLFGTIIEREGRFKFVSYANDM